MVETSGIKNEIFVDDVECIIFETLYISISLYVLTQIEKHNIRIIFCDEKYNPYGELKSFYGCHNMFEQIIKQISWKETEKNILWGKILLDKKQSQNQLLEYYNKKTIENDYTEANFAAMYFNRLFGRDFVRFNQDSTNSALNYGYTLLLSKVNRIVVSHGFLTEIGFFHKNKNNNYNLSCDLMEPFRPVVDKIVFQNTGLSFDTSYKRKLQMLFEEKVSIDNKEYLIGDAIDIYIKNKLDFINKQTTTFCELKIA